jgi:hypothetical protein
MIGPRLSLVSDWSLVAIMPMNSTGMKSDPSWSCVFDGACVRAGGRRR